MKPRWVNLREQDQAAYRAAIAFLNGRLEEHATIDWALRLKPQDTLMRMALFDVIDSPSAQKIKEPWQSAWRLIEESWKCPVLDSSMRLYDLQHRIVSGDRSGSLVAEIVELVAACMKVEPYSRTDFYFRRPTKQPKKVEDLLTTRLTSGKVIDPGVLKIPEITDRSFLVSLAIRLDDAVNGGLDLARRIDWPGEGMIWQLGGLNRVYYVPTAERGEGSHEPDEFHEGIAPSVKLLYAVVASLVDIDISAAIEFLHRWKSTNSLVHIRLWAALSRNSRVTSSNEVAEFLIEVNNHRFWNVNEYPEIAELRAKRFGDLELNKQVAITSRIRKYPPRNQWPREADTDRVKKAQFYLVLRELRRIEIGGSSLPSRDKTWLNEKIREFPNLLMARLDEGFLEAPKASWVGPNPDSRYDLLTGEERLKALEIALSSASRGWDDDPAGRATDWIRSPGNPNQILKDFESVPTGGAAFGAVWERFGWAHSPRGDAGDGELKAEAARVLSLLKKLQDTTIRKAIAGIAHWLSAWEKHLVHLTEGSDIWFKVWPIAVDATNEQEIAEHDPINSPIHFSEDQDPKDLDTLNAPAGKLVGVFLASCPNLGKNEHPFDADGPLLRMREAVITSTGRSGLIARHRLTESLPYFLEADWDWTQNYLIMPLIADNSEAISLWSAIARRTHFSSVLGIIGEAMAERATDRRLNRETRNSLVFSLIIEILHAFRERRDPVIPHARIQQMIRSLEDEVRAFAAGAIQLFVRDVSGTREGNVDAISAEELFRSAAVPFLKTVWPQERSLTTPGISRALANLPATSGEAFAEAVAIIEPFLVPFDCWSMIDYGLYGEEDGEPKLSIINSHEKAAAFLQLLDLTIGRSEGAIIPHDLANALDRISYIAPDLRDTQIFRRLATAARRI